MTNKPAKPRAELFLVGDGKGPPTIGDLVALVTRLTGRAPTEPEIAEARAEHEAFLAERAAQEAATSGTPVAPANGQPRRPSTEDDDATEES